MGGSLDTGIVFSSRVIWEKCRVRDRGNTRVRDYERGGENCRGRGIGEETYPGPENYRVRDYDRVDD